MKNIIILVISLFFSQWVFAFSYTVEVTEAELQEKVTKLMPLVKKKFFVTVTLDNPNVKLSIENSDITIFTEIEVSVLDGIKGTGNATIRGSLEYDSDNYEFYFKKPFLENLEIDNVPEKYIPKIKKISQQIISKALATHPIYRFSDNNLKHKLAKSALQSIVIKNKILFVTLGF